MEHNVFNEGSTVAVIVAAAVLSFCGALTANFVTYLDLWMKGNHFITDRVVQQDLVKAFRSTCTGMFRKVRPKLRDPWSLVSGHNRVLRNLGTTSWNFLYLTDFSIYSINSGRVKNQWGNNRVSFCPPQKSIFLGNSWNLISLRVKDDNSKSLKTYHFDILVSVS